MKLLHHSYSTNGVRPSAPPFRTHRRLKDNLLILAAVYVFGVVFGHLAGYLF